MYSVKKKMSNDWKSVITNRLRERNLCETSTFHEIIVYSNRLFDENTQLRSENLRLNIDNKNLIFCQERGKNVSNTNTLIQSLEKKLLAQQDELIELHKRKGENAQMIVDMNVKLTEQTKTLQEKEKSLLLQIAINRTLTAEVEMLTRSIEELKVINSTLRDEFATLLLHNTKLEEKMTVVQNENQQLVVRLLNYKDSEVDKANRDNDNFVKYKKSSVDLHFICNMELYGNLFYLFFL